MKTIIILVVIVVVMAGAAYFVVSNFLAPQDPAAGEQEAEVSQDKQETASEKSAKEIFMIEELLVNPTGTSGTRFLSASIGLEVNNHETVLQLEEQQLPVRDMLITILSSRTVEQLTSSTERELMREEITNRLSTILGPGKISAVYFVDYVLQ